MVENPHLMLPALSIHFNLLWLGNKDCPRALPTTLFHDLDWQQILKCLRCASFRIGTLGSIQQAGRVARWMQGQSGAGSG